MLLQAKNIEKRFGGVHALKGVSFNIKSGEILGLVGNNGAGKSTLVNIIAGLYPPDNGEIFWEGKRANIPNIEEGRKIGIELVPQDAAIMGNRSVAENIFMGREPCKNYGFLKLIDKGEMAKKAKALSRELGLEISSPYQEAGSCSGGERKGIAIARAIQFESRLVILDEPTAGLSVEASGRVLNFTKELKSRNVGCIFVTHNIPRVYSVADRFIILSRGEKIHEAKKGSTTADELENKLVEAGK